MYYLPKLRECCGEDGKSKIESSAIESFFFGVFFLRDRLLDRFTPENYFILFCGRILEIIVRNLMANPYNILPKNS